MNTPRKLAVLLLGTVAGLAMSSHTEAAEADTDTNFALRAPNGEVRRWTPAESNFYLSGHRTEISFGAKTRYVEGPQPYPVSAVMHIVAPPGDTLHPGRYYQATCTGRSAGRRPAMQLMYDHPICGDPDLDVFTGWYFIRQVEFDPAGKPSKLEVIFFHDDGGQNDVPPVHGEFRYNAAPMLLALKAEGKFLWTGIRAPVSHGDTGTFSLSGDASTTVTYRASVPHDKWAITLQPPVGAQLKVGAYRTREVPDASTAGLVIRPEYRQNRYCISPRGSLNIVGIDHHDDGSIKGLHATFEYRCTNSVGALKGHIRHGL